MRVNGDGNQSRGFTYIDDIARGTIAALKPLGYEVINLGGHEVISINQLVEMVEELTGKQAVVQHGPPNLADMRTNQADVAKARGMAAIAKSTGLGRESLYKALAPGAKPRYDTIIKVLHGLGVKITVTA